MRQLTFSSLVLASALLALKLIAQVNLTTLSGKDHMAATNSEVDLLLRGIAEDDRYVLERDKYGHVISLSLRHTNANDRALSLVSTIPSIQELSIVGRGSPTNNGWTAEGVSHLKRMTNLATLRIACLAIDPDLNADFLPEVSRIAGLKSLSLVAAPQKQRDYAALTNLCNLTTLKVWYVTNFGDAELALLTNLPNLTHLELVFDCVTREGTNVISRMPRLTNFTVKFEQGRFY
jgi:hypothetical protein